MGDESCVKSPSPDGHPAESDTVARVGGGDEFVVVLPMPSRVT